MRKAFLFSQVLHCFFPITNSTTIAPDNRIAQHLHLLIDQHQSVHLIGNTYRFNVGSSNRRLTQHRLSKGLQIEPPGLRILLSPT